MRAHSASPREAKKTAEHDEWVNLAVQQIDNLLYKQATPYLHAVTKEKLIDRLIFEGVGSSVRLRGKRRRTQDRERAIRTEQHQEAARRVTTWRVVYNALECFPCITMPKLTYEQASKQLDWKTPTLVVSDACVVLGTRNHYHPNYDMPLLVVEPDEYDPAKYRHLRLPQRRRYRTAA